MKTSEFDTDYTDSLVCPWCGYDDPDSWEIDFGAGMEGDIIHGCVSCGKPMLATRVVNVTYTTTKHENQ